MMAGNPNWCWSMIMNDMHYPHDQSHQISSDSPPSSITNVSSQFPLTSWSQLLLGGLVDEEEEEEERLIKKFENNNNWEEQQVLQNPSNFTRIINTNYNNYYYDNNSNNNHVVDHVIKQEQLVSQLTTNGGGGGGQLDDVDDRDREILLLSNFSNNNNNFFNFSGSSVKAAAAEEKSSVHHHNQDHRSSHECNSRSSTGVVSKKARVYHSSAQPALKVRKEKLGDRITALHQLVSPFGKTDTASVLSEAIANIRFLQARIQALSFPYMRNAPTVNITGHHIHKHSVQERNCLIQEDADQVPQSPEAKDLRSRGLCLVPISCTENIGNDNGADYWPPSPIGGGF
ncbi:hypothetical protein ABFS82_04G100100 [Erythranthe guttata]